jgi:hypothetical protein
MIFDRYLTRWGFMVVLPRTYATGRRMTMTAKTTQARVPIRQLLLSLSAAALPPLEGMTRTAVVGLLAQLLISVSTRDGGPEGRDETR